MSEIEKKVSTGQTCEVFQLNQIINELPGDIYWKDKAGHYLGMNQNGLDNLQKMGFSWKKRDIIGKTDYDLFDKKTADQFKKHDIQIMKSGIANVTEETALLPSGEKIIQLSTKTPLFNKENDIIGVIGNTVDITNMKKLEQNLKKAKILAESASEAKSNFIRNMSHDLRTPLTGLLTLSEDMVRSLDDENPMKQNFSIIFNSSKQLSRLFESVLESAKLDFNHKPSDPCVFSVNHLINQIIELFYPSMALP